MKITKKIKKQAVRVYTKFKISAATFSFMAGLGITNLYAQGGGPVPPCLPQYTANNNNVCGTQDVLSNIPTITCGQSTNNVWFRYRDVNGSPILKAEVIEFPSAANAHKTKVRVKKCNNTAFMSAGKMWVHDPMGYSYCQSFSAGASFVDIYIPARLYPAGENTTFQAMLDSNSGDKFVSQSFSINFNAKPCKIYPQQNEQNVPIMGVNLQWEALITPSPNLWKYVVFWRKKGIGSYTQQEIIGANNNTFSLPTLEYSTEYEYNIVSFFGSVSTPHLNETFTFKTMQDPNPVVCYPEIEYRDPWEWDTPIAHYRVLNCADDIAYLENPDDPAWIDSLKYNAATGNVEVYLKPNETLNYRYATLRIYTNKGKRWIWQVVQKPIEFSQIVMQRTTDEVICGIISPLQIEANCVFDNNDYFITVVAVTEEEPNGIVVGYDFAANMLTNGFQLELPANSQRFSNVKKLRFILQANYGGYPGGSYLQTTESDYFFAGVPSPVFNHQTTLEACENGTYQCRFLSANNAGNFKYRVYDRGAVIDEVNEYFTIPVGTDAIDLVVETFDTDCNTKSQPYNFTITPASKPNVAISLNSSTSVVNQPITVSFSADQAQNANTAPIAYVSFNNGTYTELTNPIVNNAFSYTPTQIGNYKFRLNYRGELCWGEAISDEIVVTDAVIAGTDIYVNASTGNDVSGNGTLTNPYKSLAKGNSQVMEGSALIFKGDFSTESITIDKDITLIGENEPIVGNITVAIGKNVTVGGSFSVKTQLELSNTATMFCIGNTITFKSDATSTAIINTNMTGHIEGEVIIEKFLPNAFHLKQFGSPVQQVLADLPSSSIQMYNESIVTNSIGAGWQNNTDLVSIPGKGYRSNWLAGTQELVFWGTLNNADSYTLPFSRTIASMVGYQGGYNAFANPFQIYLSGLSIFNSNAGKGLGSIIYYTSATSPSAIVFRTWNVLTGVGSNGGTEKIAPNQGFYLRKLTLGTEQIVIGKVNRTTGNSNSFREENLAQPRERVRIEAKSGNEVSDVVLDVWKGSTKGYEAIDQELPTTDEVVANLLYMPDAESKENLLVNEIPKLEGVFPLVINSKGKTTIRITETTGNTKVALFDKQTGEKIDLAFGTDFEFQNLGNSKDRFVLLLGDSVDSYLADNQLVVYPNPATDQVTISTETLQGFENLVRFVQIFDMLGREVYKNSNFEKTLSIDTKNFTSGVYLVKVSGNDKVITKKLVIE